MLKKSVGFLLMLVIVSFLGSGCAGKNEVITEADQNIAKEALGKEETKKDVQVADNEVEKIKTNVIEEQPLEEESLNNKSNPKDSYINETVSVVDGQKVVLRSIHFKFDDYHLTDEMVTIANNNAQKIDKVVSQDPEIKIKLEGNCDEWGTDEYNYALGLKRAKSVKESLVKYGINGEKIVIVSYGESNPICNEHTISCWKRNRRVDYKLLP